MTNGPHSTGSFERWCRGVGERGEMGLGRLGWGKIGGVKLAGEYVQNDESQLSSTTDCSGFAEAGTRRIRRLGARSPANEHAMVTATRRDATIKTAIDPTAASAVDKTIGSSERGKIRGNVVE